MTTEEFNSTGFYKGMEFLYSGRVHQLVEVDFKRGVMKLRKPLGIDAGGIIEVSYSLCEMVKRECSDDRRPIVLVVTYWEACKIYDFYNRTKTSSPEMNAFIEKIWKAFGEQYEKGLIFKNNED